MNKVLIGAFSLVAAATLTACGSSGGGKAATNPSSPSTPSSSAPAASGGSGSDAAKAAIAADILKNAGGTSSPFAVSKAQANCVADAAVNTIGLDKLHTYGLLTADNKVTGKKLTAVGLSTADATTVVNAYFSCVGNTQFTNMFKQEVTSKLPASLTAKQRACFEGKVTIDAVKRLAIADLTGQTAATTQFEQSLAACMAP